MLVDDDRTISFCKFVKLNVGMVATSVQLVVVKSEFCCNAKSIEGIIHEMTVLPPEGLMLNKGAGVDCQV